MKLQTQSPKTLMPKPPRTRICLKPKPRWLREPRSHYPWNPRSAAGCHGGLGEAELRDYLATSSRMCRDTYMYIYTHQNWAISGGGLPWALEFRRCHTATSEPCSVALALHPPHGKWASTAPRWPPALAQGEARFKALRYMMQQIPATPRRISQL